MIELLMMGKYGIYVWPAYTITVVILGLNIFLALREKNKTLYVVKKIIANQNES